LKPLPTAPERSAAAGDTGGAFAGLDDAARAEMKAIGPDWARDIAANSQRVKDAYAPALARAPRDGITVVRNLAYGVHARQVLDVFHPPCRQSAGVVVFVHGGAFVRGAKCVNDDMYDNVLYWFARQGMVGVNVEYRLAPEAPYPQGGLDVAAAMEWVHKHIAAYGGDNTRVMLVGHSAGGTHAASYVFDPAASGRHCRAAALVLISARLRADQHPDNPNRLGVRAYFGDDEASHACRSPVSFAGRSTLPAMVVTAQYDNPLLDLYGLEFAWRLACARGQAPRFLQMALHNHMSIVAHFNSGEERLGREILAFFADAPGTAGGG
jgi:acetyl esterase